MTKYTIHTPVLLDEVIQNLNIKDGGVYVDGTFGAGGYSREILKQANCKLYAIDRDPNVAKTAEEFKQEFGDRFELLQGCFGDMQRLLKENGVDKVDGIVLDIGVSSMQIDQAERGFSFMKDGPLDMRMSAEGQSAEDVINDTSQDELANIIYKYGDERKSRRIARAIVIAREEERITTTRKLAQTIRSVMRVSGDKIDPATRTFQAIRIWVNDELGELERALEASRNILSTGGRIVVVTFHSLEDSIVKNFIKDNSGIRENLSRHSPINLMPNEEEVAKYFKPVKRKAIKPSDTEIRSNIRSRSAKLRAAIRTSTTYQQEVS